LTERGERMDDFERIYAEYYDAVYGYCLRLTHDHHLAEEVTQESFFKALKAIDSFHGECRLQVWLCQIAKNTYFSLLKKRKHAAPMEGDWPDPADLEERLGDQEEALQIHRVLHTLPEPYREVFWLRTFGELSFAQIGRLFEKTESWARVTYHRARLKIKEELE
jgi:RNA polymerase sigma-70 factor (ECF subfamily)